MNKEPQTDRLFGGVGKMNVSNYPNRLQVPTALQSSAEPRNALSVSIRQPSRTAPCYVHVRSFTGRSEKTVL